MSAKVKKTEKKEFDFRTIKTFNDACKAFGTSEKEFNKKFDALGLDPDTINYEKLKLVIKAVNNGWKPNWQDCNQPKFYPWFEVLSSGFGFDSSSYNCTFAFTGCGSRLCFQSREKSDYTAKQFIELYNGFLY
jgi:hypothetical protein